MKYFKYRLILADVSMILALLIIIIGVVWGQENPVGGIAVAALGFTFAYGARSVRQNVFGTIMELTIAAVISDKIDKLDKKIEKLLNQRERNRKVKK